MKGAGGKRFPDDAGEVIFKVPIIDVGLGDAAGDVIRSSVSVM